MRLSQHIAISVVSVAVFFIVWQVAATQQWVDPLLLPSLTDIGLTTEELLADGYRQVPLWEHIAVSLARALSAFTVAVIIGIPLGLLMGLSEGLAAVLNPFVQFLRPLPKIALIPLAVVWLGIGEASKFFLIFIATFLSVVVGRRLQWNALVVHVFAWRRRWALRADKSSCVWSSRTRCRTFSPPSGSPLALAGHR